MTSPDEAAGGGSVPLQIDGLDGAERIGNGSFGVVYRARQAAYNRTVAVKVLYVSVADSADRRRFEGECRALGTLSDHPHIVVLHSAGVMDDGRAYLIMAYMPGGSLAARAPLGWQEATTVAAKIAGALAAAHAAGILHRDIKPENILISAYGEPQLADFGVARMGDGTTMQSGTGLGAITGTLAHAAPEVVSGLRATEAADVWSLASTLATLISGKPPFSREGEDSPLPMMRRILEDPPTDLRAPGLPEDLCQAIESALAKDTWDRTPSAAAFGQALESVLAEHSPPRTNTLAATPADNPAPAGPLPAQATPTRHRNQPLPIPPSPGIPVGASSPPPERPDRNRGEPPETTPPPRPRSWTTRWSRRRVGVVLAAVLVAVAGTAIGVEVANGGHSGPNPILQAIAVANSQKLTKNQLPPSSCKERSKAVVTCSNPYPPSIDSVQLETYPSLTALYSAYTARAESLTHQAFVPNRAGCDYAQAAQGEETWNTKSGGLRSEAFSVAQLEQPYKDTNDAGRVFCADVDDTWYFVWTTNDGRLLAVANGKTYAKVEAWWHTIHHDLEVGGGNDDT